MVCIWVKFHELTGLECRSNQEYSIKLKLKVLKETDSDSSLIRETDLKFNIAAESSIIKIRYLRFRKNRGRPKISDYKGMKRKSDKISVPRERTAFRKCFRKMINMLR